MFFLNFLYALKLQGPSAYLLPPLLAVCSTQLFRRYVLHSSHNRRFICMHELFRKKIQLIFAHFVVLSSSLKIFSRVILIQMPYLQLFANDERIYVCMRHARIVSSQNDVTIVCRRRLI